MARGASYRPRQATCPGHGRCWVLTRSLPGRVAGRLTGDGRCSRDGTATRLWPLLDYFDASEQVALVSSSDEFSSRPDGPSEIPANPSFQPACASHCVSSSALLPACLGHTRCFCHSDLSRLQISELNITLLGRLPPRRTLRASGLPWPAGSGLLDTLLRILGVHSCLEEREGCLSLDRFSACARSSGGAVVPGLAAISGRSPRRKEAGRTAATQTEFQEET